MIMNIIKSALLITSVFTVNCVICINIIHPKRLNEI